MKKIIAFTMGMFFAGLILAQAPQAFKYQAVARDASGNVLVNKSVSFRISILSGSETGTVVYSETHTGKTTNAFGLTELHIGMGTPVTGAFYSILWYAGQYYIKVEMDPLGGVAFQQLGTSQLLSVPYALHAKNVELEADGDALNEIQALSLVGNQLTLSKGGGTVTLPTSGGGTNPTGPAGGDLSGTYPDPVIGTGKVTSLKILDGTVSNADLADNSVTTLKIADGAIATADLANSTVTTDKLGNLAVAMEKIQNSAVTTDKLAPGAVTTTKINAGAVTGDRIAQMSALSGQVLKWNGTNWGPGDDATGGAAGPWQVSGTDVYYNGGKVGIGRIPGIDARQFQVVTDSYQAIAGENNSASYATIYAKNLGTGPAADFRSKIRIADGTEGTGKVLTSDINGYASWQPLAIHADAANFSGDGTLASPLKLSSMGASSGQVLKWNGTVWDNANDLGGPFSEDANYIYNSGSKDFGFGINKPSRKVTIADGSTSCYMNIVNSSTGFTQSDGLLMGMEGLNGWIATYESGNLYLGTGATSRVVIASDGDVGIGIATPSTRLDVNGVTNLRGNASDVMMTCSSAEAIWYNGTYYSWGYGGQYNFFGDEVTIGTSAVPGYNLVVNGTAAKTGGGSWSTLSDFRMKNIRGNYTRGLSDILQLKPVRFTYKSGNPRELNPDEEQIGFIAQEVQKVFPEAVTLAKDGYLDFNIHPVNVALVNAIQELKAENDLLKQHSSRLENEFASLKERLEKMEALLGVQAAAKDK